MQTELEIKEQICDIGRRIYNREMVAANDGNISVKLNDHEYLVTPTGISKGFMTPEYICKVDENGNILEANGITPFIVRLSGEKDPDEYIIKNGFEAMLNNIENPIYFLDFKLKYLKKNRIPNGRPREYPTSRTVGPAGSLPVNH